MTVPAPGSPSVVEVDVKADAHGVKRAMATISQALMTDAVSLYLSTPEQADPFHHAVMQSYLDSGPQLMFQADDYGCCALLCEVRRQSGADAAGCQQQDCKEQEQEREEQEREQGGKAGGADLLAHAQSGREEALERLGHQPVLESLLEEHGAALSVHFIGVDPRRQGQGLGSAMLRHLCQLADSMGRHMYLEASTTRSQALYARHGFVHVADKPLGEPGEEEAPVMRVMVRPPSSVQQEAAEVAAI